ncbi:diiron oxygenase [Alteromonas macleodii]|uniref:p-aminobenzoate N-oxygenase AurF n=1 Tax=Alteromonas macleodii TaxID=28108 RepID=A0A6T9Y5T8_ALTMA|nr:diiron oxygenase [Alteromonas macleodii]CAB9495204.1 conserved protein of unknown function [Alteromonas macleodii]
MPLDENVISLNEDRLTKVSKLIKTSHHQPMDFATVLPWDNGVDLSMYPKQPDHLWIYGTEFYEQLNDEQRLELAWLETGRDISMFIWLEQTIPVLYMGYVNKYHEQIDETTKEYLMLFSKEELVHTMTFKKFMQLAGLEMWKPPVGLYELLTVTLPKMAPSIGILFTLLIEWVAELGAMHTSQKDNVEPMARQLFKAHHFDEARHIAFGRWISEAYFENASEQEVMQTRAMAKDLIPKLINMFSYNPEIALHTSYKFPVQPNEQEKIMQVWGSENNQRINSERFSEFYAWIDKLGLR